GGIDDGQIMIVENELEVILPESYKWFLRTYGSGGIFGVDILGVGQSNKARVVEYTKDYRKLGLNNDLVIIENADEFVYCLYTSKMESNECPVIAWSRHGGVDDYNTANTFHEFFSQSLLDAKEAWEEDF